MYTRRMILAAIKHTPPDRSMNAEFESPAAHLKALGGDGGNSKLGALKAIGDEWMKGTVEYIGTPRWPILTKQGQELLAHLIESNQHG